MSAQSDALPGERPTRVRYLIIAVTILMAVLLYLDRFCVSFAERYIRADLGLTDTQMAWFISLFFWSYALGQVPSGWLGDRWGPRAVLALYILSWSVFTALMGFAAGFGGLAIMRLGCGLAQAGAFPASGSLLSRWVPLSSRGFASGLVALGGRIGGAAAPVLTAYLIVVFVPLSTPALLSTTDVIEPMRLCSLLALDEPSSSNAAPQRFRELWPADTAVQIDDLGKAWRDLATRQKELRAEQADALRTRNDFDHSRATAELDHIAAALEQFPQPPGLKDVLRDGLNTVLENPSLYDERAFARLRSLEREGLDLIQRRSSGKSLEVSEVVRLNRLLLEAVFPTEVGKLYVRGWRPVVIVYGVAGLFVAAIFWFYFRNSPEDHPGCNAAERTLIESGKISAEKNTSASVGSKPDPLPLGAIIASRSLWMSSISQFGTNVGWLFLVTWLARYLIEEHQVPILERSWMAAAPPLAGIVAMFLGGHLTDWLTRKIGLRWGRALPMALTRFTAAGAYVACLWLETPWAATIAFAVVFMSVDLGVSATWAFCQDVGGRNVGSVLGWGNMWGNVGAALAPQIYNHFLKDAPKTAEWHTMFIVCAGMFVLSGVAALGIDASKPIQSPKPNGT